jgi:hypothetical protein
VNDDDDIAATMAALPDASDAPKSDEQDISDTLASLDTPHVTAPAGAPKVPLKNLPYAQKVSLAESSGNAHAKNPTSSATGTGQFIDSTWLPLIKKNRPDLARGKSDADLLAMRNDPDLSAQMTDAYAAENAPKLTAAGVPVSDATKYGAHWFGPDTYAKIHNAPPTTPIEKIIGAEAAKNNGLAGKTTDDVKGMTANRMGDDYAAPPPGGLSWGDTASLAAHNFLPSVGHAIGGVYDAVRHLPTTIGTLKDIGIGLDSKIDGYMGHDQIPEQKAKDEALVDAMANSYKEKYGTIDGFKQYLAHDPAGVLFDASTVLSGGELAAGRVGAVVGNANKVGSAITAAGKVAGTVGSAINPINPLGIVSKVAGKITTPASALDAAGNVTPKVDALIQKVTDGKMKGADLVDPDIKAAFAASIAKKGLSEASVREGLLKSLGAEAPTSIVTKSAPPVSAKPRVQAAIDGNNEIFDKAASGVASAPSSPDLGAALDKAHTASLNAAGAAYGKIRTLPGSFGATMPQMADLGSLIKNKFDRSGIPTLDLKTLAVGHPQAAAAIQLLKDTWGSGRTLLRGDVNSNEILSMRKQLNDFRSRATGSDIKAVGDITDAFDQHLANQSAAGKFVDASGKPVQGLGAQIKAANTAYRTHFNTFETPNGTNNGVVNAVRKLKTGQARSTNGALMPSGDPDLYTHAQAGLAKDLLHPTKGANTYNQLAGALGGNTAPIDDLIKGSVMHGGLKSAGDMLNNHPVVQKAFASSPDDLSRAKHIQAARDINNAKPSLEDRAGSVLGKIAGQTLWKGIASLAGEHFGGPMGAVLGPTVVEPTMERIGEARAAKAAMAGAPKTSGPLARTAKSVLRNSTRPLPLAIEHYSQDPSLHPIMRASGGKVDSDALVERLIKRWKDAKKATDRMTEPLLKVPDATIQKALNIAQEHI